MQNFAYLIGSTESRDALVLDPAWDVPAILQAARENGMTIRHAAVSHTHADHVNGLPDLLAGVPARVHVNPLEAPRIARDLGASHVTASEPGTTLVLGDVTVRFIHTPGHTPGSQCLFVTEPGEMPARLLSGDTLFIGACGRCDLPGGDAEMMYHTLTNVLGAMPEGTILLPGHDYGPVPRSTLGDERNSNPYLQQTDLGAFVKYRMRPRN
jgi:glyoxylase-like metal-dependent hydrolase (beta-lactamase superfamily II)